MHGVGVAVAVGVADGGNVAVAVGVSVAVGVGVNVAVAVGAGKQNVSIELSGVPSLPYPPANQMKHEVLPSTAKLRRGVKKLLNVDQPKCHPRAHQLCSPTRDESLTFDIDRVLEFSAGYQSR